MDGGSGLIHRPRPLFDLRHAVLNPTADRGVVSRHAPIACRLLEITIIHAIAAVRTNHQRMGLPSESRHLNSDMTSSAPVHPIGSRTPQFCNIARWQQGEHRIVGSMYSHANNFYARRGTSDRRSAYQDLEGSYGPIRIADGFEKLADKAFVKTEIHGCL